MHGVPNLMFFFFFLMLCVPAAVLLLPMYWRRRERMRLIEVAFQAAAKGDPLPAELLKVLPARMPTPERDLRNGVIWLAIGIGLFVLGILRFLVLTASQPLVSALITGVHVAAVGILPLFIGAALVLLSRAARHERGSEN